MTYFVSSSLDYLILSSATLKFIGDLDLLPEELKAQNVTERSTSRDGPPSSASLRNTCVLHNCLLHVRADGMPGVLGAQ